jgi:hypothetical protein
LNRRPSHTGLRIVRPSHPDEQIRVEKDHSPAIRV